MSENVPYHEIFFMKIRYYDLFILFAGDERCVKFCRYMEHYGNTWVHGTTTHSQNLF